MKRRKKSSLKVYYVIAIICLVVLFAGYGYVYKLSEQRKTSQEKTTISLPDEPGKIAQRYNKLFAKIMSYFNIFFKETFEEYDENGLFDKDTDPSGNMSAVVSGESTSLDNIEIYNNSDYSSDDLAKATVLLTGDKKNDFFTISEMINTASRMSNSLRDIKLYSQKANEGINTIILHTHGTEAYMEYKDDNYRTENVKNNIIGIGSIISDNLKNFGFNITHLKDYNDLPNYNLSYVNSKNLVSENLKTDKKNFIIDIHRDGADEESNYEKILESVTRIKINDKYIATYALIIGGSNENIQALKNIAGAIKDISDRLYPGLCRGIIVRDGAYFNQELSDYSLLVEVGSNLNTNEEAKATADFLSEILGHAIIKISN